MATPYPSVAAYRHPSTSMSRAPTVTSRSGLLRPSRRDRECHSELFRPGRSASLQPAHVALDTGEGKQDS
jgi:hypothetical protein